MKHQLQVLAVAATVAGAKAYQHQLDIPDSAFTSWQLPTAISGPCDVSIGPDNFIYVQEFFANKIARFNQNTGEFTEYDIPFTVPGLDNFTLPLPGHAKFELLSCAIRTGYDGYMYFSNGAHNQIVRHDVHSGETVVFTPPPLLLSILGNLQPLNDLTAAPDGIYFTQTTGNQFTSWTVPTLLAIPLGIYYSQHDDGIWFLEFGASKVGRLDRHTHEIEEFDLPLNALQPLVVRAETVNQDGSTTLWFACTTSSTISGINTRTGAISVYQEPNAPTETVEVAQDLKGNVWATHILQNTLGVLNPKTGNLSVVVEPSVILDTPGITVPFYGESGIFGYAVGQPPGQGQKDILGDSIWYTHFLTNQLIKLDLTGVDIP
ncbi:soluble quino protein glucose dehydrogenase [Aureobasidium pullulans]|uniref:Soluble quino protein glucose dehydrogenase n=1 Tax=Aureobasidium pullulans TaxID=5580 RepID=A0A4S8T2Y8_AURPU|nr:soluble quino protein glucose dehydrogenase [Aureobasidium pullulans]